MYILSDKQPEHGEKVVVIFDNREIEGTYVKSSIDGELGVFIIDGKLQSKMKWRYLDE